MGRHELHTMKLAPLPPTVLACLALVLLVSGAPPSFPASWTAQTQSGIAIFQGGTKRPDGSVCCAGDAPGCKVQTVSQAGTTINDGVNNRTRTDGPQGIIVNWYGTVNKQLLIQPNPAGKGYVCTAACPIKDGDYRNPLELNSDAKDAGPAQINGVLAE